MKIENAFILAAGKGTRMGPLGEVLPKPLWPIFKTTLVSIQIKRAYSYGVKKVYINLHHQKENLKKYLDDNHPDVIQIDEEELLDVGGAVHNLVEKENLKKGNLLILNVDTFHLVPDLEKYLETFKLSKAKGLLFLKAFENNNYADVKINKDGDVTTIDKKSNEGHTYSGMSIINLDSLVLKKGVSKFFDTVLNYKESKVLGVKVDCEYWDLGTQAKYYESLYRLMCDKSSKTSFKKLLESFDFFINPLVS